MKRLIPKITKHIRRFKYLSLLETMKNDVWWNYEGGVSFFRKETFFQVIRNFNINSVLQHLR